LHTTTLVIAAVAAAAATAQPLLAADTAIRTPVALSQPRPCAAPVSVAGLAQTYYQRPVGALSEALARLLDACHLSGTMHTRYAVILFAAKPTPTAKAAVVHLLYDAVRRTVRDQLTLLGVGVATWIYASDEPSDEAVVQLSSVSVQNPILGQLGKLASTIVPKLPATEPSVRAAQTFPIFLSTSPPTPLPLKRARITETDSVDRSGAQIEGTATFNNQPRTWLTVNAGAGAFAGKATGDAQTKIDNKTYVSDPLARGATFAGVTFHHPYDGSEPQPSRAERYGLVVAAVLTPALGVYVGPSYGWRGIALTAGWAEMFVNVPPTPNQIGDPVENHDRLATGRAGRLLIAVSYAFGD
jgi:hypothetical protein